MPSQLALPLSARPSLGRADFVVAPGNAQAVAFIDSWPHWPVGVAAVYGPPGSGKTHLATIWQVASGAVLVSAVDLGRDWPARTGPLVIEDVDSPSVSPARDALLFQLIEGASPAFPLLLTAREPPTAWPTQLPDLASRYAAILSLPVWAPDDMLLSALARKLLADRQLSVPSAVIDRIVHCVERSPDSVRSFIARADARAMAEARPINLALVRELIAEESGGLS